MAKRGRKSKYSDALAKRICEHIANGVSMAGAAKICGIGERTFHEWREKMAHFAQRVDEADAASEAALVAICAQQASQRDGKLALMMLERRHGAHWHRHESREVTANHTLSTVSPQVVQGLSALPESERQARIEHSQPENPTKTDTINV